MALYLVRVQNALFLHCAGYKFRKVFTMLEQLNAANPVDEYWTWMGGYLHGLAHEGYYFSLANVKKAHGDRWVGEFTCGNGIMHDFLVFCGDPERDAILKKNTPKKVYKLKMRDKALASIPVPWDVFQLIEVN
jgi:hypothetical protein